MSSALFDDLNVAENLTVAAEFLALARVKAGGRLVQETPRRRPAD